MRKKGRNIRDENGKLSNPPFPCRLLFPHPPPPFPPPPPTEKKISQCIIRTRDFFLFRRCLRKRNIRDENGKLSNPPFPCRLLFPHPPPPFPPPPPTEKKISQCIIRTRDFFLFRRCLRKRHRYSHEAWSR